MIKYTKQTTLDNFTLVRNSNDAVAVADRIEENTMLLAFLRSADKSVSYYSLANGFIDGYQDETGINTGSSTNELYSAGTHSYSPDVPSNMTLVSAVMTAVEEPNDMRIVLYEEDVDAITLNTDLIASVSRDGGTTWTVVTLEDEGTYDSTKRVLAGVADVSLQPTGTSVVYKIVTANAKDLKLYGASLSWA